MSEAMAPLARAVLDHHGLAQAVADALRNNPRGHVGAAAGEGTITRMGCDAVQACSACAGPPSRDGHQRACRRIDGFSSCLCSCVFLICWNCRIDSSGLVGGTARRRGWPRPLPYSLR